MNTVTHHCLRIVAQAAITISIAVGGICTAGSGELDNIPKLYTVYIGPSTFTVAGKEARTGTLLLGGLGGGFTALKTGKKMIGDYSIEEPMIALRAKLATNLRNKYSIKNIYGKNKAYKKSAVSNSALKKRYGDAVVLRVSPQLWWLSEYAFSPKNYYLRFYAKAELISLAEGKRLWKGKCKTEIKAKDKKTAPSIQMLRENNATLFKSWMSRLTKECADLMINDIAKKL